MKKIKIIAQILFVLSFVLIGCSDSPTKSEQPELHSVIKGEGPKTVVFESGLGDGLQSWDPIIDEVAAFSKVVTYNRAGYAPSPELNTDRNLDNIVAELRDHLKLKGVSAPYTLVGHSYGGLIMYYFARKYPNEVEALILLDSTPYNFVSRMRNAGVPDSVFLPSESDLSKMHPVISSEFESIINAEQLVNNTNPLGDIPLRVLTSSKPNPGFPIEFTNVWVTLHEEISNETSQSLHLVSDEVGHYIHHEVPEIVVDVIKDVVEN